MFMFAVLFCNFVNIVASQNVDNAIGYLLESNSNLEKLAGDMGLVEGPVWMPDSRKLIFTDIPRSKVMECSVAGGLKVVREDSKESNGQTLDLQGRLVTCRHVARDIVRADEDGSLTTLVDRYEGKRFNSPNDVVYASDGSVWFTDPPWGRLGFSRNPDGCPETCIDLPGNFVFHFSPESKVVTPVIKDLCMPNGIAFSPDERYVYVADTGLFPGGNPNPDLPACHLPPGITAFEVTAEHGLVPKWRTEVLCDGMRVDVKGNIYTTTPEGITVLLPNGEILGLIRVPESPANCAFGGEDLKTLFITARTSLYSIRLLNPGVVVSAKLARGTLEL